jgi:hypothetical protein
MKFNNKYGRSVCLLAFVSFSAQARTVCSNATGTVKYEADSYFGGAAPPDGVSLVSQTWTIDGKEYVMQEMMAPTNPNPPLIVTFEQRFNVGKPRTTQYEVEQDSVATISVVSNETNALIFNGQVLCTSFDWTGPMPPSAPKGF